ncbi:MAG TPA: phosphatidylserine/phosphatidylglycerophosphate/cardiolipin synthase family protein [Pseudobdellovibrionaceae bacterium]
MELISGIRRAQKSITLEFYIFEIDQVTEILFSELQMAVLRGCQVHLLVDGVGSFFWLEALSKRCQNEGIHFRIYHPLPGFLQWFAHALEALFAKTPKVLRRINRRNHRKTVVIDQQVAFLGSFNMTKVHYAMLVGANKAWRDSGMKIQGEAIESLIAAFDLAWTFARKKALFPTHDKYIREKIQTVLRWQSLLRLNANDKIRRHLYKDLCRRILHAKSRVYIATAYFLPKRAIARALTKAAQRGVDVRILIPGPSDIPLVKWAAHQLPYKLHLGGVKIFEFQPRVFHAKYMIIDEWSSLGSFNLNHRSLLHDLEVEAVLTDAESLCNMNTRFEQDLKECQPLELARYQKVFFLKNWITKTLFKLRYWF